MEKRRSHTWIESLFSIPFSIARDHSNTNWLKEELLWNFGRTSRVSIMSCGGLTFDAGIIV